MKNDQLQTPSASSASIVGAAQALHEAVCAIYFADSSDYLPALWSIVKQLDPGGIAELLEADGSAAFHRTDSLARGIASPEGVETQGGSTAKPQEPGRLADAPDKDAVIASLQAQVDATYKQWTGRDLMHLPLPEAVGTVVSELRHRNDELVAQVEALRADLAPLQDFVDSVFGEFPEHGDVDGFTLQELAEACGLLKQEATVVPCGETCQCAEVGAAGEVDCYRVQPVLRDARIASAKRRAAIDASRATEGER